MADVDEDFNPVDADNNPIRSGEGQPVKLTVQRGGETLHFMMPGDTSFISLGVQFQPRLEKLPLGESLLRSLSDARDMVLLVMLNLKLIFTPQGAKSISGPVGIMALIGQSAQSGWYSLLHIVILLNVFIGVFNLLPVPALDGGRLVFVMLSGIGIRVAPQREALVHLVGMIMLLGLILVVTFSDILAFF
jgi:regulator of sigma E protease